MKKSTVLRKMLREKDIIVCPGAYDALSARIIEMTGFECIIHTGYGTAASMFGIPDIGLVSYGEMVERVRQIAGAVNIPVIGDADTGYGNAVNVYRTVQGYIGAGAAGLFIEDQVWPKKCGHMLGKAVISAEEMVGKIKAAVKARDELDPDFVVGARTDAIATHGLEEAIRRAKMYHEAGADFIFVEAIPSVEAIWRVTSELKGVPLMLNLIEGGKTPLISVEEAKKYGFKIVIFPLTALYAAAKAMYEALSLLKEHGSAKPYLHRITTFEEFNKIVGLDFYRELEKMFLTAEELALRYGRQA
ncbi:MAG: isocitrate lyase/PEP mutase family protein [Desulfurococcaceae archaeon]